MVKPESERIEHLLSILRGVGAVAVEHEHVRFIDDPHGLDDGVALPFSRLRPDSRPRGPCDIGGTVGAVPVHDEDVLKTPLPKLPDQVTDRRSLV